MTPMETLDRYGADAVRYWAGSTGTGKDAVISEEKMAAGAKLVTKLWSVASFSARFLEGFEEPATLPSLSPADRWIVSRAERLKGLATAAFRDYEYAVAKNETEGFFWRDLCDNYLEMAKKRLYDGTEAERTAACFALSHSFYTVLVLLAPIMPFVTEEIYGALFRRPGAVFLHGTRWPEVREELIDTDAEAAGEALVAIATAVRRYKSERNLSLGAPLAELRLTVRDGWLGDALYGGEVDIASITRAQTVTGGDGAGPDGLETVLDDPQLGLLVQVGGAAS